MATYKGVEPSASLIQWFWEVMESFSNTERSLFLRFVWGRTRLPRTIADFRGRDFVIQVQLLHAVGSAEGRSLSPALPQMEKPLYPPVRWFPFLLETKMKTLTSLIR